MPRFLEVIILSYLALMFLSTNVTAAEDDAAKAQSSPTSKDAKTVVEQLDKPLYTPFVERYVLDELKQLRTDLGAQKSELIKNITDRELAASDRVVTYATDTVTYFFYLIAGVSSILVLVGWTSIREMKERVHTLADEEISKLVSEYEERLAEIEKQLNQKSDRIEKNRAEIELTNEVQGLWMRAAQDSNPNNKIAIYEQILKLRPDDMEALTYKADAVLELGEPQWAAKLCRQALEIDPDSSHAFYQLACAYTVMEQFDEALSFLSSALARRASYHDDILHDPALEALREQTAFQELIQQQGTSPTVDKGEPL